MKHSDIISDKKVVIYGGDYCPYCHKLKHFLEGKNITYDYRDITKSKEHEKLVNELVVKLKWSTIPMVFIN
jgi:glutaredoxin 3